MGLKEVLAKLKLVELDEAPGRASGGPAAPRDSPELAELLARVPPPRPVNESRLSRPTPAPASAAPAEGGAAAAGELPGFDEVYRAAGIIDPAHGFTAFKVLEFLASPELATLEGRARASALATFLRMNPAGAVSIADVLEDAVRRDQALDQFEKFLRSKLADREAAADREIAKLETELEAAERRLRQAIDAERRAVEAARLEFSTWREGKRGEEQRLFDAVAPFVEANPITRES